MRAANNANAGAFPVVVVLEEKDDDADYEHALNVWGGYGVRECTNLRDVDASAYNALSNLLTIYKTGSYSVRSLQIFVEFKNKKEASETLILASVIENFMVAFRFAQADRDRLEACSYALQKYWDATANLSCFEDDMSSYGHRAQLAGISKSKFNNWSPQSSTLRKLVDAEAKVIETHIEKLLDGLRLKTA